MAKNAIVVGMARSGTSLTASIFAHKGYFVTSDPSELEPGNAINPQGFWEAQGLIERNVEVLRAVGYEFHNTWSFEPISDDAIAQIRSLAPLPGHVDFVRHYNEHSPWVWKDPRLCLTLSYWWPMLSHANTSVLLLERASDEIYRSFMRVKFIPPEQESRERVAALISQHMRTARGTIHALDIPHITINHRRFFSDPVGVANDIAAFFQVDVSPADLNVDKDLNYSSRRGRVRIWFSALYMRLPRPLRSLIKRLTPAGVLKVLAPEKKYVDERGK